MSENDKKKNQENNKFPARAAVFPENVAITAIKQLKFDPRTAARIDAGDLLDEILRQSKQIQNGDLKLIERFLYAQALALDAMFDRALAQMAGSEWAPQIQLFGALALKAQAQCRSTLATLAQIKNPDQTTFIKQNIQQQNNAVNQQINTSSTVDSKKSEEVANELLKEVKHEALECRGAEKAITINTAMETVEAINGSKIPKRERS